MYQGSRMSITLYSITSKERDTSLHRYMNVTNIRVCSKMGSYDRIVAHICNADWVLATLVTIKIAHFDVKCFV
mgnify:CR=1 FL=1